MRLKIFGLTLAGAIILSPAFANTAVVPTARTDAYAVKRHEEFLQAARRGGINLLFIGDSIMEQWGIVANKGVADPGVIPRGKPIWDREFAPLHAANFSVSGDRTQNLLWRFAHGELDGIHPRLIVLMIGANNTRDTPECPVNTAPEIIAGITAVVRELRSRLPQTQILLQGIFPRALKDDPARAEIRAVNAAIAHLDDGRWVHFLDLGPLFLAPDGTLPTALFPDHLHPSRRGFEIWAEAIKGPVAAYLNAGAVPYQPGALTVVATTCEYAEHPLGLETVHPRLSWQLQSTLRSQVQSAYQIQVSSRPEFPASGLANLWDTGKVASAQSIQVPYGGTPLGSRQRCYWRVRVWDERGIPSDFSRAESWEMGLLAPGDWSAAWIGYTAGWPGRALYFRHSFQVKKPVRQARAYISGLGYYELRLNGAKVGDHVLDPGWTDYARRVLYVTYDLGSQLQMGANTVGVVAGQGWYGNPKVLLQIELTYADGTRERIASEGGSTHAPNVWQVSGGPITRNAIYDGETYDARLEKAGWDQPVPPPPAPTNRLEEWTTAVDVEPPGGRLEAQALEPIRVVGAAAPERLSQPRPGISVFDAGRNLAGWAELRISGPRGTKVTLRFAENLNVDGTVNQDNLRTAAAIDEYILKGEGREIWEPRFTYHGFRYVQVEGAPAPLTLDSLRIKTVRSDVAQSGAFACGDPLLNRIQQMVQATEASNLYSVPTDCPQRNERMGWLNDMTVRAEEAIYNFTLPRFYGKWIDDIADTQDAAGAIADTAPFKWGKRPADPVCASYFLLAWLSYVHYGDVGLIREHYASFGRWVEYLVAHSDHDIVPFSSWGDWSPPQAFAIAGSNGSGAVSAGTPGDLMSTGSLYYQVRLLALMAGVLGREDDGRRWEELADRIGRAFNRKYWNETAGGYGSNNQACNSFALYVGLVSPERRARVVANLVADVARHGGHLTTGNLCTKFLLETLAQSGRMDVAYRIAAMRTYPSWGYMLDNGATTLWERWENLTGGGMNSHNHPMMGSVSSWFFKYLGGIQADPAAPGFHHFILRPGVVPAVGWTEASYLGPYGRIRSAWRLEGKELTFKFSVPANSSATVYLPSADPSLVRESGLPVARANGVRFLGAENGTGRFRVDSIRATYVLPAAPPQL